MSDDKTQVTENTSGKAQENSEQDETGNTETPGIENANQTQRELVENMLDQTDTNTQEEEGDESVTGEGDSSDSPENKSNSDKSDETTSDSVSKDEDVTEKPEDINDFLKDDVDDIESTRKSGEQKRIDKLTAINHQKDEKITQLEDELALLKANATPAETTKTSKRVYTETELTAAWNKAYDDGDKELMNEIIKVREEQLADKLRQEYKAVQDAEKTVQKKNQENWTTIVDSFDYLNNLELYPGSTKELSLADPNSLISQVAYALWMQHPDYYQGKPNGQYLAVKDALNRIVTKRKTSSTSTKNTEVKKLERKVSKLKKKTGGVGKTKSIKQENENSDKPKSDRQKLEEEIATRKKRIGINTGLF